ncbi:MAG: DUF1223 domain-containing protein [Alphaproteobacteria bacterium]
MQLPLRFVLAVLTTIWATGVAADDAAPVLVELFTSQGCSSCPPADALAGRLSEQDDVIVLSFHVNYWDYIGWEDPFATEQTTERQYHYAEALGQRNVYTPQMVIGGATHVVGSDEREVRQAIADLARSAGQGPAIAISRSGERFRISLGAAAYDGVAEVWLAQFDSRHDTEVARGENSGRTMTNFNVVRQLHRVGTWDGESTQILLDSAVLAAAHGQDGCAVIVQAANHGPIISVATFVTAAIGG